MKKKNILKILVLLVAVILIALISFVGIYKYDKGTMVNILPDFKMGKDFGGYRLVTLKVSDDTKSVEKDATEEEKTAEDESANEEQKADEENSEENKAKETEEVPVNSEDVLTKDNYKLSKDIIEERIKGQKVDEYDIRVNEENGQIAIQLPENDNTDDVISFIIEPGDFNIIDTETEDVLLSKADLDSTKIMYNNGTTGTTVYLSMNFKKDAVKKLEDITKEYIETTDEEGKSSKKTITIKIDSQTLMTTYFGETISSGQIQIPIGNASNDIDTINDTIKSATYITTLLNNNTIPVVYETEQNQYISPVIDNTTLKLIIIIGIVILTCLMIYLIITGKEKGIVAAIALLGIVAATLLVARLTNVFITFESIIALALATLIETVLLTKLVKCKTNKEIYEALLKSLLIHIPLYIVVLIACLFSWLPIVSFGTMFFWGLVISIACNLILKFIIGNDK